MVGVALLRRKGESAGQRRNSRTQEGIVEPVLHACENSVAEGVTAQGKLRAFSTSPNRTGKSRG